MAESEVSVTTSSGNVFEDLELPDAPVAYPVEPAGTRTVGD